MSTITFETTPYTINGWTVAALPQAASSRLPSRGQVMVTGTINGQPLLTALEPNGQGGHWLHIDTTLQKSAHIEVAKPVSLHIEATKNWPEPEIPVDISSMLQSSADLQMLWADVTPMSRWEWIRWIGSSAQPETRAKHIVVAASKLRAGLRRPCCFNRSMCCVPEVSKRGVLLDPITAVL